MDLPGQAWPGPYGSDSHPEQQPAGPELVTADWLKQHLNDPNQVVFHVAMDKIGYDAGHVPGAVFAADGRVPQPQERRQVTRADRDRGSPRPTWSLERSRVVLIGDPMSIALLFVALDYVGHGGKTAVLDGGIRRVA